MPPKLLFRALNRAHIALYHASKGRVLGAVVGSPVLLLTTTGRTTGKPRTIPLVYTRDGDSFAVIATDRPAWHANLKRSPQASVEIKGQTYRVAARDASPDEETRLWAKFIAQSPAFKSQQGQPNHQIVILTLSPTGQ